MGWEARTQNPMGSQAELSPLLVCLNLMLQLAKGQDFTANLARFSFTHDIKRGHKKDTWGNGLKLL